MDFSAVQDVRLKNASGGQPVQSTGIIGSLKNKTVDPQKKQNMPKAITTRIAQACHVSESTAKPCRREAEKESKENNDGETAEVKEKF